MSFLRNGVPDDVDPFLVEKVGELGDDHGPLLVAKVAAWLTDPNVLIDELHDTEAELDAADREPVVTEVLVPTSETADWLARSTILSLGPNDHSVGDVSSVDLPSYGFDPKTIERLRRNLPPGGYLSIVGGSTSTDDGIISWQWQGGPTCTSDPLDDDDGFGPAACRLDAGHRGRCVTARGTRFWFRKADSE